MFKFQGLHLTQVNLPWKWWDRYYMVNIYRGRYIVRKKCKLNTMVWPFHSAYRWSVNPHACVVILNMLYCATNTFSDSQDWRVCYFQTLKYETPPKNLDICWKIKLQMLHSFDSFAAYRMIKPCYNFVTYNQIFIIPHKTAGWL